MSVRSFCTREVDLARPFESVWQAAVRMRQRAVGTLVVVDADKRPIGIVTDRDLMERVLATAKDPNTTTVHEVMTPEPTTIGEEDSIETALALMREGGLRRLPVVDADGILVGLLSLDDVLMLMGEEMAQVSEMLRRETPRAFAEEPVLSRWD
jgi:CBS domain-containing protein